MNAEPDQGMHRHVEVDEGWPGLAALTKVTFDRLDAEQVLDTASAAVATVSSCRVEATYRDVHGGMVRYPPSQPEQPDFYKQIRASDTDVPLSMPDARWGRAFGLRYQDAMIGWLIVSAAQQPARNDVLLLTILAQQTGAALAYAALHDHDADQGEQLAAAVDRLQSRTTVHEVIGAALAAGSGEQGIADALHELTALPVSIEDQFGNLRAWAGLREMYPKPDQDRRERLLHDLAVHPGPARIGDQVAILAHPHAGVLGVLALIDPDRTVTDNQLFALKHASIVLGLELVHQRNLAEMELGLRRELVDDLLTGTDEDSAYARAEALDYDLRPPQYVVALDCLDGADSVVAAAAGRAATALHLNFLRGRHAGLVVLITAGRPDPRSLHDEVSRQLGRSTCMIGIGTRCDNPGQCPQSFAKARRALNVRLHSATPQGASAYDELSFYHLIETAQSAGVLEDFIHKWLGVLIDYDYSRTAEMVQTLSAYLESGGSYDEAAAALHIHRSTLRYRVARIGQLTGYDLRDVDTRLNLHVATRAWRFLTPAS